MGRNSKHYFLYNAECIYGDKKYLVCSHSLVNTPNHAWYNAIVEVQNHFEWTHWCELENNACTADSSRFHRMMRECGEFKIVEVGQADSPTFPFASRKKAMDKKKSIEDKIRSLNTEFNPDEVDFGIFEDTYK